MSEMIDSPQIACETVDIFGIPALTIYPQERFNLPVVFFVYGFGENKESGKPIGMQLARKGFFFISIDAYFHGDHKEPGQPFPGLFNIIRHTSDDIAKVIEGLRQDSRIDDARIAIIGVSMGSLAAFYLAVENRSVSAIISIIGNPDFEAHFRRLTQKDAGLKWVKKHNPSLWEVLLEQGKAMNPASRIADFYPRPLLMLNGTQDEDVPMKHAAKLYKTLQPFYQDCRERLSFQTFESGHEVTPEMNKAVEDWIGRFL